MKMVFLCSWKIQVFSFIPILHCLKLTDFRKVMHGLPKNGFYLQRRTESSYCFCIRICNEATCCFLHTLKKMLTLFLVPWWSKSISKYRVWSPISTWDLIYLVHGRFSFAFTCPILLDTAIKVFCNIFTFICEQTYRYTYISNHIVERTRKNTHL